MLISDWSSDVCSSDLKVSSDSSPPASNAIARAPSPLASGRDGTIAAVDGPDRVSMTADIACFVPAGDAPPFSLSVNPHQLLYAERRRSEEHTSELQSLMRISYAVFCLKKQKLH